MLGNVGVSVARACVDVMPAGGPAKQVDTCDAGSVAADVATGAATSALAHEQARLVWSALAAACTVNAACRRVAVEVGFLKVLLMYVDMDAEPVRRHSRFCMPVRMQSTPGWS